MSVNLSSSATPPSARFWPFIVSAGNLVYLCGGKKDTEPPETVFIFHRNTKTWSRQRTRGLHPPPGLGNGGCCISGQHMYIYGGEDEESYHEVLYELNTNLWTWKKLSDGGAGGPGKKSGCRMISYKDYLLVVGGYYEKNSRQVGSSSESGHTNEVHFFNLTTGLWSSPSTKGYSYSPCDRFSLTVTDENQAVMFGGITSSKKSSTAYVLHLPTMTWAKYKKGKPWPKRRYDHTAACLGYGGEPKALLIIGGLDRDGFILPDMWLLDLESGRMEELQVPVKHRNLIIRDGNCVATLTVNSDCVEVIFLGGYDEHDSLRANPTILRFVRQASAPEGVSLAQRWILTDPDDEFIIRTNQKLEASDDNVLKVTKVQASSVDAEVTTDNVDDSEVIMSATMQDTTSTASSDKKGDFKEVISLPTGEYPIVHDTQEFVSDVIKAVDQNQQIQRKMANVILKGLPEVGKSTLLNRLLKRPFKNISSSTGVSDGIVVVDIQPTSTLTSATASDNSSWEVIDFDTSMYSQLEDLKNFLPSAEEESIEENTSSDSPSYKIYNISRISEVPDNIKKVLSAYNVKSIEDLKLKNSLYIRDTGGQVEFQESLTLLVYGPSIFIFVLRTDIDIYKKNIIQYRSPNGEIVNKYKSSISTVDALVQFLSSVSAIDTTEEGMFKEGGAYKSHEPVVFIVGTHIDLLKSRADSVIAEINCNLDRIIQDHGFSDIVVYANFASLTVMYTVDNTSVKDDNFKHLRSDINGYICSRHEFMVLYPVSYLLFCLELQNMKASIISIVKFRQLASKFSITSRQINHLLHFLHFRIGIIQYYDIDNLSDIVIKEPQVLFNKVTDLLVKTFLSSKSMKMDQQRSFQERGIMDAALLESILGENENQITAKHFLAFMVHLRLAVPFTDKWGKKKYFIPSVLNHAPASTSIQRKTDIAPLAICFQLGHCPQGLFGVLISHLVSPDKSHNYSFDLSEDKIYQDQVFLIVSSSEEVDQISLKRYLSHIEVNMYLEGSSSETESIVPRSTTPTTVCTTVRSILQDCLQLSMTTLHYDGKKLLPKFCLACPTCTTLQEVKCGAEYTYMNCKSCSAKQPISLSGRLWFNQNPAMNAPVKMQHALSSEDIKTNPSTAASVSTHDQVTVKRVQIPSNLQSPSSAKDFTLQHLTLLKWTDSNSKNHSLRLRDELSSRWRDVGDLLGVDSSRQDGIHAQRMGDVRLCCRDILLDWLQMEDKSYPPSWEGLLVLLEDLELNNVAKKLNEALDSNS